MPLQPGDKLGPYEIRAPIGKGGKWQVSNAGESLVGREREFAISVSVECSSNKRID